MLRRLIGGTADDPVPTVEVGREADEDSSSVGSDWTQVSMNSSSGRNVNQAAGDVNDSSGLSERRQSMSTNHSDEFGRVSEHDLEENEDDLEDDVDYSSDDGVMEGDEIDIAIESSDSGSDGEEEEDNEEEQPADDILIVERQEVENVLEDGTQYEVDSDNVARLFDTLSATMADRKPKATPSTEQDWTDDSADDAIGGDELSVDCVEAARETKGDNYVHAGSPGMNSTLTLVAVISLAVVCGVGIGHFAGAVYMSSHNTNVRSSTLLYCAAGGQVEGGTGLVHDNRGTTHSTWLRRKLEQKQQVEQLKVLQHKLESCVGQIHGQVDPLRSEIVEWRKKFTACQLTEHTCALHDRPQRTTVQPTIVNQNKNDCSTVVPQRKPVSSSHTPLAMMQRMAQMRVSQRTLVDSLKRVEQQAEALRTDLRMCKRDVHQRSTPNLNLPPKPMKAEHDLIDSFVRLTSNITTAVQTFVNDARREAGRASAVSPHVLRLIGKVAKKSMVTAVANVWNRANTMLQEHRPLTFKSGQIKAMLKSLPSLLCPDDQDEFDETLVERDMDDIVNVTAFPQTPVEKPAAVYGFSFPLTRADVYKFRKSIKKSAIRSLIGRENTQKYLAQLKPLTGKHTRPFTPQQLQWLTCQQHWWTSSQRFVCDADDLTVWQTSDKTSFAELIAMPHVRHIVDEWQQHQLQQQPTVVAPVAACSTNDERACDNDDVAPVCPYKEKRPEIASKEAGWMFTRSQQRAQAREEHERQDWFANRYRDRASIRKAEQQADWLFERQMQRQKERQKRQYAPHRRTFGQNMKMAWRRVDKMF